MKTLKIYSCIVMVAATAFALQSCKSKKLIAKPKPVVAESTPVSKPTPPPAPTPVTQQAPAPATPNFNFTNIQFDYNSAVLRTDAIQYLDHVVTEMKLNTSAKFVLKGNASSEGTPSHNMSLSVDRANAVKQYLANEGIDAANLTTKGYGAKKPIASNKTESGRELNRRVEIKLVQ